jgi:hypothetical protein
MDGYADVSSETLRLADGGVTAFDFAVPLVSTAAMRQMGEMIRTDERLQSSLPEICGEELRMWEAGLLVGTVRARATEAPVPGTRVSVDLGGDGSIRSTLSSPAGVFVLCNVPLGTSVEVVTETPGTAPDTTRVEIRAGMVSWYDLVVGPPRPLRLDLHALRADPGGDDAPLGELHRRASLCDLGRRPRLHPLLRAGTRPRLPSRSALRRSERSAARREGPRSRRP